MFFCEKQLSVYAIQKQKMKKCTPYTEKVLAILKICVYDDDMGNNETGLYKLTAGRENHGG